MGKKLYLSPQAEIESVFKGSVITMSSGYDTDDKDNAFDLGGELL